MEWLEKLGYCAESRGKVVSCNRTWPSDDWKTLCVNPAVPASYQGKIRLRKERNGLPLAYAVPKIKWDCNPNCPYGYKAIRNLYVFFCFFLSLYRINPQKRRRANKDQCAKREDTNQSCTSALTYQSLLFPLCGVYSVNLGDHFKLWKMKI